MMISAICTFISTIYHDIFTYTWLTAIYSFLGKFLAENMMQSSLGSSNFSSMSELNITNVSFHIKYIKILGYLFTFQEGFKQLTWQNKTVKT